MSGDLSASHFFQEHLSPCYLTLYGIAINITVQHFIYMYTIYIINPVALSFHLTNKYLGMHILPKLPASPRSQTCDSNVIAPDCTLLSPTELNSVSPNHQRSCSSWRAKSLPPDRTLISGKVGRRSRITLVHAPC